MGEQHLALLGKNGLVVFKQGQVDVFQGQAHHLFAVRVVADQAHQTGHRVHDGVARLPGQFVAVARGARGGVAQAAGGHQHGIRLVLPARGAPHAYTAVRRAGLFLFGVARVLRGSRGSLLRRGQRLQQQLLGPVLDENGSLRVPEQCLPDLFRLVGYREHPAAALHFQLHTQLLKQLHRLCRRERP